MPISIDDIAPKTDTAAAPVAPPAAPEPAAPGGIPDDVLKIPAFSALLQGAPPALYAPYGSEKTSPEVATIAANIQPLMKAGFGVYAPLDGSGRVIFNTQFVTPEELKVADKKGKLATIAPPFSELLNFFNQGLSTPTDQPAAQPQTAVQPSAPPPSPGAEKAVARIRATALSPGGPTSGPVPGQGRLLNSVLKPVV